MKVKKLVGASNLLHLDCGICCYVQAAITLIDENGLTQTTRLGLGLSSNSWMCDFAVNRRSMQNMSDIMESVSLLETLHVK